MIKYRIVQFCIGRALTCYVIAFCCRACCFELHGSDRKCLNLSNDKNVSITTLCMGRRKMKSLKIVVVWRGHRHCCGPG